MTLEDLEEELFLFVARTTLEERQLAEERVGARSREWIVGLAEPVHGDEMSGRRERALI